MASWPASRLKTSRSDGLGDVQPGETSLGVRLTAYSASMLLGLGLLHANAGPE